jgi:hypothetical protein
MTARDNWQDARVSAVCARCRSPFAQLRGEDWRRLCVVCFQADRDRLAYDRGFEAGPLEGLQAAQAAIPPERIRALLQLCHPDRHGGSALATSTTMWLLVLRRHVPADAEVAR